MHCETELDWEERGSEMHSPEEMDSSILFTSWETSSIVVITGVEKKLCYKYFPYLCLKRRGHVIPPIAYLSLESTSG